MKMIIDKGSMCTPLVLLVGQEHTAATAATLMKRPGTAVVSYHSDGLVVRRRVSMLRAGEVWASEWILELAGACMTSTVRADLLVLLRRMHRRHDVDRIVVVLDRWMEPEPLCYDIHHTPVFVGPGYVDGPASGDVTISAVVTCIDTSTWLAHALGDDELGDGRSVAAVVVDQAEFADVLVLSLPDHRTEAVLRRLAPRSRITCAMANIESILQDLHAQHRRGADFDPHQPVLAGEPPLTPDGDVALIDFTAGRPFHPERLHAAIDVLLDDVVRARGRIWLASQPDTVVWIESTGGELCVASAGRWLAAMRPSEIDTTSSQRRAMAAAHWDVLHGDRHVALTILTCGADPDLTRAALQEALLTDDEFAEPELWAGYPDPFCDWHAESDDALACDPDIFSANRIDDGDLP
jgi:G3E family GTPase